MSSDLSSEKNSFQKALFLGCGNLASAVIKGLIRGGSPHSFFEALTKSPESAQSQSQNLSIECAPLDAFLSSPSTEHDLLFLAVKPYQIRELSELLEKESIDLSRGKAVVSLIAGLNFYDLEKLFPNAENYFRVMANTAFESGEGLAVASAHHESTSNLPLQKLLERASEFHWVPEFQQEALTALSGSAPAFFFQIISDFKKAAVDFGIDSDLASALLKKSLSGASKQLQESSDSPEELIRKIATPGGMTEAGLKELQSAHYAEHFEKLISAVEKKGQELGRKV